MKIYALEIDFFRYISCYLNCMRMLRYNYKEKNYVKQQRREHTYTKNMCAGNLDQLQTAKQNSNWSACLC